MKALVFQARTSLAASRKARETPCEEIREQVANLRGGALRRTTLHRHLRECAGCRAFRDEVALQRKTLAVALPVIPTVGLKEAALGAAFGSGTAGGGAAAVSASGALAAKALVAVALVGGGTTAGVEATRQAVPLPRAAERSAHAAPAAAAVGSATRRCPRPRPPRSGRGKTAALRRGPRSRTAAAPAAHAKPAKPERQPPRQAHKADPKQTPPGQAKKADPKRAAGAGEAGDAEGAGAGAGQAEAGASGPGQAEDAASGAGQEGRAGARGKRRPRSSRPTLPPGQAKKLVAHP